MSIIANFPRSDARRISRILFTLSPVGYGQKGSDHSSQRSTRNLKPALRRLPGGQPIGSLFDLAPRRVCPAPRRLRHGRWSLTPPFHRNPCGPSLFCGTFHHGGFPPASRLSQADPPPCGVRTFLCRSRQRPVTRASLRGKCQRTSRSRHARYRMRPHIVHATIDCGLPASPFLAFASASCPTLGGCTRWHPSQTPSWVSATTTGQRFIRSRS